MSNDANVSKRDGFRSRGGFIIACIGSAVGMANVWGFPNKMGSNGGGATEDGSAAGGEGSSSDGTTTEQPKKKKKT